MNLTDTELNKLDSWRGLLSLIVLLAHTLQIFWFPSIGLNHSFSIIIPTITNLTVVAFFCLSGIVISYSVNNKVKKNDFNWRMFLLNRFSRIYPNLIASILLCVFLFLLYGQINNFDYQILSFNDDKYLVRKNFEIYFKSIFYSIFMLHPGLSSINGSLWSLFIEWWIYISSIFIIIGLNEKNSIKRFKLIFAIIPLYLTYFNFGISSIIYVLIWYLSFFNSFIQKRINILLLIFFLIIVFNYLHIGSASLLIDKSNFLYFGVVQITFTLLFLKFLLKVPTINFFSRISKFSYTLYIIHFPILLFSFAITRNVIHGNLKLNFIFSILMLLLILIFSKQLALFTENKKLVKSMLQSYLKFNINEK